MASMIKQAFLDVIGHLEAIAYTWNAAIYANDKPFNNRLFQEVSIWNNHVKMLEDGTFTPAQSPCIYIESLQSPVTKFLGAADIRDFMVRLHIIDWQLDAGDGTTSRNVEVFDYRDLVKTALYGFKLTDGGRMQWVSEEQDYNHGGIYHYTVDMKAALLDFKGDYLDPDQAKIIYVEPPLPQGFPLHETIDVVTEI